MEEREKKEARTRRSILQPNTSIGFRIGPFDFCKRQDKSDLYNKPLTDEQLRYLLGNTRERRRNIEWRNMD